MKQDPYLAKILTLPPLVAYKRPPNIKDKIIRAKIPDPPPQRLKRKLTGMKKCNKCPICPYVKIRQAVKASKSNYSFEINTEVNCQTKNLIYILECKKCSEQYIGETNRTLQERFSEHIGYVKNKHLHTATGDDFNQRGHSQIDMSITILEKIHNRSDQYRKIRETMFISKFNTKHKGMNRKT